MTITAQNKKILIWEDTSQIEAFKNKVKAIASELRNLISMYPMGSLDDLWAISEASMKAEFMKSDKEAARVGELVGMDKIKLPDQMTYIIGLAKQLQFDLKPNKVTGFNMGSYLAIKDGKIITNDTAIEAHCEKWRRFAESEFQQQRLKFAIEYCNKLNSMQINQQALAKWKNPTVIWTGSKWIVNVQFVLDGSGLGFIPEIKEDNEALTAKGSRLNWPVEKFN